MKWWFVFPQEVQETCLTSISQIYCTALLQNVICLPSRAGSTMFSVLNTPPGISSLSWPRFRATTCPVSSQDQSLIVKWINCFLLELSFLVISFYYVFRAFHVFACCPHHEQTQEVSEPAGCSSAQCFSSHQGKSTHSYNKVNINEINGP